MNMGIIAASRLRASAIRPFIIEVNTTNTPGASNANQFEFTGAEGDYDVIAKQNGVITDTFNNLSDEERITFTNSGTYDLEITPKSTNGFNRINFNDGGDLRKIIDLKQFGDIVWSSFENAFFGCFNLEVNATDIPNLSNVTDMSYMFRDARIANPNTTFWNVSSVLDMSFMFHGAELFNQPLNNWNVSSVLDMSFMFYGAELFNQPLNNWNVSNVTNMVSMFNFAELFNQPLNNWNVSSVTDMTRMFSAANAFNQPLNNWNVSNVLDMNRMFAFGSPSFNQDLSAWCVEQIPSKPTSFDNGATAWTLPNSRPDWGATC